MRTVIFFGLLFIGFSVQTTSLVEVSILPEKVINFIAIILGVSIVMDVAEFFIFLKKEGKK